MAQPAPAKKDIRTTYRKCVEALRDTAGNYGGVTSIGFVDKHGELAFERSRICVAFLSQNAYKQSKAMFIYQESRNYKLATAWVKFLLGPKSPYRDIVKRQPKQKHDDVIRHGYIMTDLKIASNYLVNFLMAFRLAKEKPFVCETWLRLVEDGIDPAVAAFLVDLCDRNPYGKDIHLTKGSWHYAFAPGYCGMPSIEHVRKGTPLKDKLLKHTFFENTNYTPNNSIWGASDMDVDQRYLNHNFYDALKRYIKERNHKAEEGARKRLFAVVEAPDPESCSYEIFRDFCRLADKGELVL